MKLNSVLTDYFCKSNNIDVNTNYRIEKIDASELITPERIDLIAKLKYVEYRQQGYDLTYIKEVYAAHIEAFSFGTYTEEGNDSKNSIMKYFNTFDKLIDDIKKNGMDENISVIPVGSNNIILDGAHRTAIAAYYNLKVPIIRFNNLSVDYGAGFFKKRLLDDKYLDYLVYEYCKYKNNVYIACVWPNVKGKLQKLEITNTINKNCKIIYKKRIKFNYEGLNNLIIQIYSSQSWIGNFENHFAGAKIKTHDCYDRDEILTAYILECESPYEILELKARIRDVFQIGNHSIHIIDNHAEGLKIASLLLNKNSIDFSNKGKPNYYKKRYIFRLISSKRKNWLKKKIKYFIHFIRVIFFRILKKIGVYEMVREVYYFVKGVEAK